MKSKYENMKIIYNRSKLGWYWSPLFFAFWILLFYLIAVPSYHHAPETITIKQEAENTGRFIGERAENNLLKLSKIGPKVVGSAANEQAAVQLLLTEINSLLQKARFDLYDIEQDVQIASGNFEIMGKLNVYQRIQNVLVKVKPFASNSTSAILINSHFDTVPHSSGAGDAGIMIVIMLEVLRTIVTNETPLTHSLIFLLNGAEENQLKGSHAFITQHKWAKDVKAFINLDSSGSGGREILFQAGPNHPWLVKYYAQNIMHPFASSSAEELFQNGLVPSDTDFHIFRNFGDIPGLDMAHVYNGYVYHTKYDRYNIIPKGTYQSTGDNVLALVKGLANAPELENPPENDDGTTVFYDVLGWFTVYYSTTVALILNIIVCVLALVTIVAYIWNMAHQTGMFRRRIFAKFSVLLAIQIGTILLAVILTMALAFTLDAVGLSMSWYSHTWMIFGLYFCPMFFAMGILPAIYFTYIKEHGLPLGYAIQLIMHAHCFLLTILEIYLISMNIRSAYLVTISIAFYTISVIINIFTCFHKRTFLWLIPHIICQIMPYLFYTYLCYAIFTIFIPLQGRSGVNHNPEIFIAGFTVGMSLLLAPFLIPLICLFRKAKIIISLFGVICVAFIILAITPIGFPYTEKLAPQRFKVLHTTRTFHNDEPEAGVIQSDSGFFVVPEDRHPDSIIDIFNNQNMTVEKNHNCKDIMCGLPTLTWRQHSLWVPGPEPNKSGWPEIKIAGKQRTSSTNILYTLDISGPDHMNIILVPLEDAQLIDWSFNKTYIDNHTNGPFIINFSYALDPQPLRINLEFKRSDPDWVGPTFHIVIIGQKMHSDIFNTDEFRSFLNSFPAWTTLDAWTASFESWSL